MSAADTEGRRPRDLVRQVSVVAAIVAVVLVNALANSLPIGGRTTGEVSSQYPVLFTPAGYAFSIWGLIYLSLLAYAVTQALPARRASPDHRASGWLFVGNCGLNIACLLAWHNLLLPLSLLIMFGLLISLILIYLRLDIGRRRLQGIDYWTLHFPFSLYLGWITVATVANVTITLYAAGWRGWGVPEPVWAVVAIAAALFVGLAVAWRRRDVVFSLVLVWAFFAIAVGQSEPLVVSAAIAAALLQGLAAGYALVMGRRRSEGPATHA